MIVSSLPRKKLFHLKIIKLCFDINAEVLPDNVHRILCYVSLDLNSDCCADAVMNGPVDSIVFPHTFCRHYSATSYPCVLHQLLCYVLSVILSSVCCQPFILQLLLSKNVCFRFSIFVC